MKKQKILETAIGLFEEKGISNTSVQEITDECGISKGAFYLSFKSKDELIQSIVDQFMEEYILNVDQLVSEVEKEELLREFLLSSYRFGHKHRLFSRVYMKEQLHKVNEDILRQVEYYDRLINQVIFRLVDKLYPEFTEARKYEFVYILKSFTQLYQVFSLQLNRDLQMEVFVESISQKIELLAQYETKTFITEDILMYLQSQKKEIDQDLLGEKIQELVKEEGDPIIQESLILLYEDLKEAKLPAAVLQGLLNNLKDEANCREVVYLYQAYLE